MMNAFQPSRPPLQPVEPPRRVAHHKKSRRPSPYQVMALETTAKLAVNVLMSAAVFYGLVQLLSYQSAQQQKLREIQTEVKLIEGRVNRLQTDFSRYFAPQQAESVMQEQSNRVSPGQRQVILLDKADKEVEEPAP